MNMYESYGHGYVTWTSYSIFSANDFLTPVTLNDPRLTFDPIKSQEGLKLINMYKSYSHCYVTWTSYSIFSENDLLTPVTPNNPRLTFDPIT